MTHSVKKKADRAVRAIQNIQRQDVYTLDVITNKKKIGSINASPQIYTANINIYKNDSPVKVRQQLNQRQLEKR